MAITIHDTFNVTGSGTAELVVEGTSTITFYISGSWTGFIYVDGQMPGSSTWIESAVKPFNLNANDGNSVVPITATDSYYSGDISALGKIRFRCNTVTGTATIDVCAIEGTNTLNGIYGYVYNQSNTRDGSGNPITSTSGALDINIASGSITASNPSVAATGAAVPAQATYSGMNVSGNLTGLTGTVNGLKVDGSAVTQPVSASSLPLPTGASTSALQTTGNTSLSSIDTKTPALGQTTMAGSTPVAIASNQSAIPASQSGTWNINNVSGTVSLPTGASTAAKQPALGTAGTASSEYRV
jgi:hypothetical protein